MRYQIVEIKNKETKVTIKCRDSQEQALLKISLFLDTLECTDKFIPDSLQRFIELHQDFIREYINYIHAGTETRAG